MRITKHIGLLAAVPLLAGGLAIAGATAASAAPPPTGCSGAGCVLQGNLQVTETVTMSATPLSFTVPGPVAAGGQSTVPQGTGTANAQFVVTVTTGDSAGFGLYVQAATDWADANSSFAASNSVYDQPNAAGCWSQAGGSGCGSGEIPDVTVPEPGASPAQVYNSPTAQPSGLSLPAALIVSVPAGQPQGSYALGLNLSAIGS